MSSPPPDPPPPAPLAWRLVLHGPPRLAAGSRSVPLERKAAGVLAWLALRGPALRLRLAELLWPTAPPEGARNSLRQVLFKLKRATDATIVDGQETLHLPAAVAVDAGDAELLEGCAYDDCPDFADWLAEARAAHRQQLADSRLKAADTALASGDAQRALALARQLVAGDALAEPAHLRLVQALYLLGDRAGALAAAARCEALLREHVGAEPSAALRALVATVQQARPDSAGGPTAAHVPVAVLRPPRLVGRSRELALLAQAAREGRVALLSGEPGLGKSRLLAEAAGDAAIDAFAAQATSGASAEHAELLRWRARPGHFSPAEAAARREQWAARGLEGHVVVADTLAARDAALAGRPAEAAALAALALAAQRKVLLVNVYRPWLHLELARAAQAGDAALAERARREGAEWVHNVARYQLPEPLRDAFVQRNRINRELIALAAGPRR